MLLAIPHDEVSIGRLPWVTWTLAVLGSAAFLATLFGLDLESAGLGMDPGHVTPLGFATYWLFSTGLMQWLLSTLLLLAIGPHLEQAWGARLHVGFLLGALTLPAGIYAFAGPSGRPLVGIAGAIAALIAALLVRNGFSNVETHLMLGASARRISFETPAYMALIAWFVGEVLMSVTGSGEGPTRGSGTTLAFAGALFGAAAAWAVGQWDLETRLEGPAEERGNPVLVAAQAARDSGRPGAAVALLEPAVRQRPNDAELVRALCDAACAANEPQRASGALRRLITEQIRAGEAAAAAGFWRTFGTTVPDLRLDPRTSLDLAAALVAAGDKPLAARVLRNALDAKVTPGIALRIVELAAPLHRETAIRAARIALSAEGMDEAKRKKLEARVAELESGKTREPEPELDIPRRGNDRTIDVELDENYAPLKRPVETAAVEAAEAAFELSADGSLVTGESHELAERLPDTEPLMLGLPDSSDSPDSEFDRDALRLDPDAPPLAEELPLTEDGAVAPIAVEAVPAPVAAESVAEAAAEPPIDDDPNGKTFIPGPAKAAPVTPPASSPAQTPEDSMSGLGMAIAAEGARFHELKCIEAVPVSVDAEGISMRGGSRVELSRVDGIAVAAVHGMSARPVILIDLLLNWTEISDAPLRCVRLRSDQFDPRALFPSAPGPLDAFRALLDSLLASAGATPLPDPEAAHGRPFRMFPELARYEREVLQVER